MDKAERDAMIERLQAENAAMIADNMARKAWRLENTDFEMPDADDVVSKSFAFTYVEKATPEMLIESRAAAQRAQANDGIPELTGAALERWNNWANNLIHEQVKEALNLMCDITGEATGQLENKLVQRLRKLEAGAIVAAELMTRIDALEVECAMLRGIVSGQLAVINSGTRSKHAAA